MQEDNKNNLKYLKRFVPIYTVVIIFLIAIFWGIGQSYVLRNINNTVTKDSPSVPTTRFVVRNNQSVFQIASDLSKKNIINSNIIFILYSFISGDFSKLKPGIYIFPDYVSVKDVVSTISQGPKIKSITFYPGMTVNEMDGLLSKKGFIKKGELKSLSVDDFKNKYKFLSGAKTLEGYLSPDTYYFYYGSSAKTIAEIMLRNFWKRNKDLLYKVSNINKIITIASLIEKEVVSEKDKKLVSSVIYNRLKIGMPLQIDSSIIYKKCNGFFTKCSISKKDFKEDNAYNTYTRRGLPLTPISNPTHSSIDAAINPAKTDYLYYLSDDKSGKTFFSHTFGEHNYKRWVYLKQDK